MPEPWASASRRQFLVGAGALLAAPTAIASTEYGLGVTFRRPGLVYRLSSGSTAGNGRGVLTPSVHHG